MSVGLLYSTTTGNTETVAGYITAACGVEAEDIGDVEDDALMAHDALICGAPTWHTGADEQRSGTAWDEFLYDRLPSLDLTGKKVGIFGLGDQGGYSDNQGRYLGHFPLVSADFWTSDHLSERSRSVDAFSGTRARGTLTLKRR